MNIEINDRVSFKSESKEYSGAVMNKFIQNTELELNDKTEMISATAEDPAFLIETDDENHHIVHLPQIVKVL